MIVFTPPPKPLMLSSTTGKRPCLNGAMVKCFKWGVVLLAFKDQKEEQEHWLGYSERKEEAEKAITRGVRWVK